MIFGIKRKMYHFEPCNVFLAIATNIPVLLMTCFVVQGHISINLLWPLYFSSVDNSNRTSIFE